MSAESEFIGYLIVHPEEVLKVKSYITTDMISDSTYRAIYAKMLLTQNTLMISESLKGDYPNIEEVLKECALNQSYSLKNASEMILREDRARKLKSLLNREINANNINEVLLDLGGKIRDLTPKMRTRGDTAEDLAKYKDFCFKPRGKRFEFGFFDIDDATGGIDKGDMCIIGARPAVGKSAFALNVIKNNKDLKGAYYNLEMSKEQIFQRWISGDSGIDISHLRRAERALNDEQERLDKATEEFKKNKNILFYSGIVSPKNIYDNCEKNPVDYVIIDYLQLVRSDARYSSRAETVQSISSDLKNIAMTFNIPVIALSQLNRKTENTGEKEPTMAELRESGAIEQDASVIVLIWSGDDDKRNIKVEKARNGIQRKTMLRFDGSHMRFMDITDKIPFD